MTPEDAAWHDSFKSKWTGTGALTMARDDEQGRVVEVYKITEGTHVRPLQFT
jgi:hypothetical protein